MRVEMQAALRNLGGGGGELEGERNDLPLCYFYAGVIIIFI